MQCEPREEARAVIQIWATNTSASTAFKFFSQAIVSVPGAIVRLVYGSSGSSSCFFLLCSNTQILQILETGRFPASAYVVRGLLYCDTHICILREHV